jgi:DNA-binding CsgD family transcriptional regulator
VTLSCALDEARAGDAAPVTLSCALDEARGRRRAGHAQSRARRGARGRRRAGANAALAVVHCHRPRLLPPVLITVDDAPWPDAPSLRLLAHVAPRAPDLPIALIIATRPPAGRSGLLAELVAPRHGDGRCPQPLSSEAIGEPATRHEVAPAPAVLEALRAASGGNALLAGPLIARVVVHVLTRSGGSAKLRFGHPVVREAALAELGPGERAALHAAAPTASHGAGAPSDRVAAHLAAAPAATSPEAAALLRLAAPDLLIDGDATTAASHLRRALEDSPGDDTIRADGPAVAIDELRSARVLCAPALDGRAAIGDRPRRLMFAGADTLVASERRIAELASRGRSNRDIAGDLVVTPKTVENHLGRVYMKLNIKGRGELSTALAA